MNPMRSVRTVGAVLVCLFSVGVACGQAVWYVDADAPAGGDGMSWATAFTDLHDALEAVGDGDAIWIAEGTYTPDRGTGDRSLFFGFPPRRSVSIYGGFAGDETLLEERDWEAHPTILSGDLHGDDGAGFANMEENSYHLFSTIEHEDSQIYVLDGLTLQGGNANGEGGNSEGGAITIPGFYPPDLHLYRCRFVYNQAEYCGGALCIFARFGSILSMSDCGFHHNRVIGEDGFGGAVGLWVYVDATVARCRFTDNTAPLGGAIGSLSMSMDATDCVFRNNSADIGGAIRGGWYFEGRSCQFSGNHAVTHGGAIWTDGMGWTIVESILHDNHAGGSGGAVYSGADERLNIINTRLLGNSAGLDGGAIYSRQLYYYPPRNTLVNCELAGNRAEGNGGAYYQRRTAPALGSAGEYDTATFINCTIADNAAVGVGGGIMYAETVQCTITNTILWQNVDSTGMGESAQVVPGEAYPPEINYCDVHGWTGALGGEGNFEANPRFHNAPGLDGVVGTLDDDRRFANFAQLADAGSTAALPADEYDLDEDGDVEETIPLDLAAYERLRNWISPPVEPPIVDIGAYEFRSLGDMNCDGYANNFDIDAFVLAVVYPEQYESEYDYCDIFNGDVNGDHRIDNFDIDPFMRLFTGN